MGEYITTFFMALLFLGPIILGALYYIFLGIMYVWAAITDFFDAIITPFTKEGKESRKKSKNIKNFEKLFKKLRNFKNLRNCRTIPLCCKKWLRVLKRRAIPTEV